MYLSLVADRDEIEAQNRPQIGWIVCIQATNAEEAVDVQRRVLRVGIPNVRVGYFGFSIFGPALTSFLALTLRPESTGLNTEVGNHV